MPKVRRARRSLHYNISNISDRKFATSADKVEKVVIGSEESNAEEKLLPEISHTKKERAKERHEKWVKRFEHTNKKKKKKKKKKSRQMDICEEETTLNISELKGYLPDIDKELESTNQKTQKTKLGLNIKPVKSKSVRKNIVMNEIQRFHKVLNHSAFKADPLSTIKQHVENTIEKKVVDDKSSTMNID